MFDSFFMGGFEASTHVRSDGVRLDMLASTGHLTLAERDYRQLSAHGIRTVRDGVRWHVIAAVPGEFDWQSLDDMLTGALRTGTQVIWDLAHYGWPDHLDIWSTDFVDAFAVFAAHAARRIAARTHGTSWFCPINEISFWSWAGAEVGYFNPGALGRGLELKRQLVRASLAATQAIRQACPSARFVHAEPLIHVVAASDCDAASAEHYRTAQYQAYDWLSGRLEAELGGAASFLDVLGVNFYPANQWHFATGEKLDLGDPLYRPLSDMLIELFQRYARPLLIAETGTEGESRALWLRYVCEQVKVAQSKGVPIVGVCWYPVLDYPGWTDSRDCPAGLLGFADSRGHRAVWKPLAEELQHQLAHWSDPLPASDTVSSVQPVQVTARVEQRELWPDGHPPVAFLA
ncbi:family 1 glycosylhydrolase [soil metagenome]